MSRKTAGETKKLSRVLADCGSVGLRLLVRVQQVPLDTGKRYSCILGKPNIAALLGWSLCGIAKDASQLAS